MTDLIKEFSVADADMVTREQVAALCWRKHRGEVQVLLVTSRETGRWVIPKGWPIAGLTAPQTAAREALEEAGVVGKIATDPIGTFGYDKIVGRDSAAVVALPCSVDVFALRVRELRGRYREANLRKRKWFSVNEAATKVDEADLQNMIGVFDPDLHRAPRGKGETGGKGK